MKTAHQFVFLFIFLFSYTSFCQVDHVELFFDGGDTTENAMQIEIDTAFDNLWQIGMPQKQFLDTAFTQPNVLITDTINTYPINNTSIFKYDVHKFYNWGITAIQWTQKIHIDSGDIALIEFSVDSGLTWENAFTSPYTYNFYGYDNDNIDTLASAEIGFSGSDTNWRDIWLCFEYSWMSIQDTLMMRHVFKSDSVVSNHDGWMIDNMLQHITFFHTIGENPQDTYIEVFPNPASSRISISVKKENQFHIIEELTLMSETGAVLQRYTNIPTSYFLDIEDYPSGVYFVKIQTNLRTETKKIIVK